MVKELQTQSELGAMMVKEAQDREERVKHGASTIVLHEVGEYYQAYGESAADLGRYAGVGLMQRASIIYAEFPQRWEAMIFPKMVKKGYKLMIVEHEG